MIERVFGEGVAPLLAPLGFSYESGRLVKAGPDYVWIVEMQAGTDSRFAVLLGVHYPSLWAATGQTPQGMPTWEICAHQCSLGQLWKGKNYRWTVGPGSDIKRIIEEITVLLLELGLPWLGQRQQWQSVLTDDQAKYRDLAATLV